MDLLNLASDERVTRSDLTFGLTDSPLGRAAELVQGVVLPPGRNCIVSGFVPSAAASSGPVTIGQSGTQNSAFLSRNVDGEVVPAQLIYGGNPSVSIDISTFPTGTYGIYVRANLVATQPQNRAFWSGVDAAEYAKLTPTRLTATWEARIETAQPAPEWLKIGEAYVVAASSGGQGATVTVVDMRPLLFEGTLNTAYAPVWGTDADRQFRRTATITNLAQMVDALKACIVDVKGPGVATWYQRHISGINVGEALAKTSVIPNRIAFGTAANYLECPDPQSLYPTTKLNAGTDQYLYFDTFTGSMYYVANGGTAFSVSGSSGGVGINLGSGLRLGNTPLMVNSLTTFPGGEVVGAYNRGAGSAIIGAWGTARPELGSMSQYGYTDESSPRSYMGIGTVGNNIQTFITLKNSAASSQHSYVFRAISNSITTGDFTTSIFGSAINIGTNGTVSLNGREINVGNRRVNGGALGWAAAFIKLSNDQGVVGTYQSTQTVTVTRGTDGSGSRITKIVFDENLPSRAIPVVSLAPYSVANEDQRKYKASVSVEGAREIDVTIFNQDDQGVWGTFSLLILNG